MIIHMLMRMLYWKVYPDVIVCLFVVVIVLFVFFPLAWKKRDIKNSRDEYLGRCETYTEPVHVERPLETNDNSCFSGSGTHSSMEIWQLVQQKIPRN